MVLVGCSTTPPKQKNNDSKESLEDRYFDKTYYQNIGNLSYKITVPQIKRILGFNQKVINWQLYHMQRFKKLRRPYKRTLIMGYHIYEKRKDFISVKLYTKVKSKGHVDTDYLVINYSLEQEKEISPQIVLKNFRYQINRQLKKKMNPDCHDYTPALMWAGDFINLTRKKLYFHFLPIGFPDCKEVTYVIKTKKLE